MKTKVLLGVFVACAYLSLIASCGRSPSRLLRVGQSPVYDFPMYVSSGAPGEILKFNEKAEREVFISGLNDPRGLAADRFGNLYVVEQGANRVTKIETASKKTTVIAEDLSTPSTVAVNSVGEIFIAQDGAQNIIRIPDRKIFGTYSSIPSALAFGVNDLFLVGLFSANTIYWGLGSNVPSTAVTAPVHLTTDETGRVYVAEGSTSGARVLRYHQREPGDVTVVADTLSGPSGIAVDPVGNIYIVEQGAARIVLVDREKKFYAWATNLIDPYYIVFTQY
jgi:sugar lactone lactonase YvrE